MKNKTLSFPKLVITLLICVLLQNTAHSQTNTYHPLPTGFTSWTYNYGVFLGNGYGVDLSSVIWNGDTTINSFVYTKTGNTYNGGIRQDIPNEKVYYLDLMDVEHDISIDNNANNGDTITVDAIIFHALIGSNNGYNPSNPIQYDSLKVEGMDSILIENSYHKRYYYVPITEIGSSYLGGITYVNGIGFTVLIGGEYLNTLVCYHEDNELIWGGQTWGGGWNPCSVSTEEKESTFINIYPNPTHGKLVIDTNEKEYDLVIFDIYGRIVFSKQNKLSGQLLDVSILPTGIYLAEITLKNQTTVKKIIID